MTVLERKKKYEYHGMGHRREYRVWQEMRRRACRQNKTWDPRWESFQAFLQDMGARPEKTELALKNPEGDYSPTNCYWAPVGESAHRASQTAYLEYQGKRQSLSQWAREVQVSRMAIYYRLRRGLPVEQALMLPAGLAHPRVRRLTYQGETLPVGQLVQKYGIPYRKLLNRLRHHPIETAMQQLLAEQAQANQLKTLEPSPLKSSET